MSYQIYQGEISSVADGGTFTTPYPAATDANSFAGSFGHSLLIGGRLLKSPQQIAVSFGASAITITNNSGAAIAGPYYAEFQLQGDGATIEGIRRAIPVELVSINIGSPVAASAAAIAPAQARAAAGNLTLAASTVTLDVPRGVQLVSTAIGDTTQVAAITGTGEYGNPVSENITLNGTTVVFGKKAFKRVTQIAISAATAGNVSAGTSDVLGLPLFVSDAGVVLRELVDGLAVSTGTIVAGDKLTPALTGGDVRGTYKPAAATDGIKRFALIAAVAEPTYRGLAQV